ncbi:MAG: hypothetical protein CVV05_00290 [Gammaproteobacteria bacterium HGW-Gammaproteobacteria-1]|jgi:hypothetical protein|nr:MAG: hypothetical protein CVV05_00290 [Gammaproteobacteria bacterium HGW-Gammaproteobacteria-1]
MSSHSLPLPTKIVLINSGSFDYAELMIDRDVHLVGDNNAGKTTLINALQFLYIDDHRSLSFGEYDRYDSFSYYFSGGERSYVLFEVLAPDGFYVFGLFGTGLGQRHAPERFIYRGRYNKATFFTDGNTIRPANQVLQLLTDREVRKLSSSAEHRHVLTGLGRDRLPNLALVPVQDSGAYEHFRAIFKNLLHLQHVSTHELKTLIQNINKNRMSKITSIDLGTDYRRQSDQIRAEEQKINDIERFEGTLKRIDDLERQQYTFLDELPAYYERIRQIKDAEEQTGLALQRSLTDENASLKALNSQIEERLTQNREERGKVAEDIGKLKLTLERIAGAQTRFQSFVREFAVEELASLGQQVEDLRRRRFRSEEPVDSLRRRLEALAQERTQLEGLASSFLVWLREHLPDEQISRLSRLFNEDVLLAQAGADGAVHIKDETSLHARLSALCERLSADGYEDSAIRITCASAGLDLARYNSPEAVAKRLTALASEESTAKQALQDAIAAEEVAQQLREVEASRNAKARELEDYDQLQQDLAKRPSLEKELKQRQGDLAALSAAEDKMRKEHEANGLAITANNNRIEGITSRLRQTANRFADLEKLPATRDPNLMNIPFSDLGDLFAHYEQGLEKYALLRTELNSHKQRLTEYDLLRELPPDHIVERAREYVAALGEMRENHHRLWESLLTELRRVCQDLLNNLAVITDFTADLSKRLNKTQVSNLQKIDILVNEKTELVSELRRLISDQRDLWDNRGHTDRETMDYLREFLSKRPRIDLGDLYELSFVVTKSNGESKRYDSLNIESTGTAVTIKVLVNVYLIRSLLGKRDRSMIPFFVDEIGKLGPHNQQAIIELARELDCVPILASPSSSDVPSRVYLLQSRSRPGRKAWLDEKSMREKRGDAVTTEESISE